MSKVLSLNDPVLEESLFKAAESKALANRSHQKELASKEAADASADQSYLYSIAARELHRRAVRERHLPAELVSELFWLILLDLFASERELRQIRLIDVAERWEMSRTSSARHTALLIELGLAVRVFDEVSSDPVTLRLTEDGRHKVSQILRAFDDSNLPRIDD